MKRQLIGALQPVLKERTLEEEQLVAGENLVASLTPREREVWNLIAHGETNKRIAQILNISDQTAATHVRNILYKLAVENRGQAACLWWERAAAAKIPNFGD